MFDVAEEDLEALDRLRDIVLLVACRAIAIVDSFGEID